MCGAGFDTAATLKRHEEREHGELRFWCDECVRHLDEHGNPKRTGFPTAWLLQNHIKQVHANCMFCGLSCNGREELEEHIEEQHSKQSLEGRKNIACTWPGCNKLFTKKSNLYAHVRQVHEGVRFVCGTIDLSGTEDLASWPQSDGCGEGFATKASLENHVRYIHLKYERPLGTATESTSDKQGSLTLLHELTGVGGNLRRTVHCTVPGCLQKFYNNSEREAHIQAHHVMEQDDLAQLGLIVDPDVGEVPPAPDTDLGLGPGESQNPLGTYDLHDFFKLEGDEFAPLPGERSATGDDESFWYGADIKVVPQPPLLASDAEWRRDEVEMRQLVDVGETLEGLIDPALT